MRRAAAIPAITVESRQGVITLDGPLIFDTVPEAFSRTQPLLAAAGSMVLDLGGVTHADSAALALIVEWRRLARDRGLTLELRALPPQLSALAAAVGLEALLA